MDSESEFVMAARHVAEGRRIVARQRLRIAKLKLAGHSTLDHEHTLQVFESTLRIFEEHERQLRHGGPTNSRPR
jgi:hypothetical protein